RGRCPPPPEPPPGRRSGSPEWACRSGTLHSPLGRRTALWYRGYTLPPAPAVPPPPGPGKWRCSPDDGSDWQCHPPDPAPTPDPENPSSETAAPPQESLP